MKTEYEVDDNLDYRLTNLREKLRQKILLVMENMLLYVLIMFWDC